MVVVVQVRKRGLTKPPWLELVGFVRVLPLILQLAPLLPCDPLVGRKAENKNNSLISNNSRLMSVTNPSILTIATTLCKAKGIRCLYAKFYLVVLFPMRDLLSPTKLRPLITTGAFTL